MYSVVGGDGQVYGPVDMATLTQWIAEGRIIPTTNLIDPIDGRVLQAQHAPALYNAFPPTVSAPPPYNQPYNNPMPGPGYMPTPNYPRPDMTGYYGPPKSKGTAILLAVLFGGIGVHRFYLGHTVTGIVMLFLSIFTWWMCGLPALIWAIVDISLIATGSLREANGRPLI